MKSAPGHALARDALDFAPGLLAIQDSPPARLPLAVLYCVAALFVILLAWAMFGRLDVVASAEGRLIPQTYVKIVQPAEGGVLREILVREGETVDAGQVLMRMDGDLLDADARSIRSQFDLERLLLRRIDAELAGIPMHAEPGDSPTLFEQVIHQFAARRQAYLDALAQERAVLDGARHDLEAAGAALTKLKMTVPTYRRSAAAYEALGRQGFLGTLAVEEKQRDRVEKEQDLHAQEATVASLRATAAASQRKLDQITSNYRSDLQNERIETESRYLRLREEKAKIAHKSAQLALRAPQRGIIKDLATHTRGTVVSPGTVLMSLVPQDEPLQAEVRVKNEDAGFIHVDQRVKLKIAGYPFQKYGMIDGTVIQIGPDAIGTGSPPSGKARDEQDPSIAALPYKALVRLDTQYLATDGRRMRISPGMQVVADIHLGRRTVLEYLLSPVQRAWQEAGRER